MRNPFTSGLGGGDKPSYRDDPESFGQTSNTAQGENSGHVIGDDSAEEGQSDVVTTPTEGGSPADAPPGLRNADGDAQAALDAASTGQGGDEGVKSRSADPGQSSYGGFGNEGTSPENDGTTECSHAEGTAATGKEGQRAGKQDDGKS